MEKIKCLNRYQKGVLIVMLTMALVFTAIYFMTSSRVGFAYHGNILVLSQENGSTVYSGKIQGQQARFTVSEDKTVVFQHGNKTYGPYTAKEDPTALAKDNETPGHMIGVELRQGEDILFRGGVLKTETSFLLYNAEGDLYDFGISYYTVNGIVRDKNGNVVDPMEPSASTILELMQGPELTNKGEWLLWFGALFVCVINAISILFADELFRLSLIFRVRDADYVEPSDLLIAGRYFSWTVLTIMALVLFIMGLR